MGVGSRQIQHGGYLTNTQGNCSTEPLTILESVFLKSLRISLKLPRDLGLQPRDKAAMLGGKYKRIFFLKNLHENRVLFPEEKNAFVLDHQHGRRQT